MTLIGNRSEWVLTMVACFRLGLVVLPCTEQLRAKDLALRLRIAGPRLVACDERNGDGTRRGRLGRADAVGRPWAARWATPPPRRTRAVAGDPVPHHVHQRHLRRAEGRLHGQRYLAGQMLQAAPLADARGPATSCGARPRSGWSKSARNVFIAPWLRGAAALVHDARFDPDERLELLERERVDRAVHGADGVPRDRQARHAARPCSTLRGARGGRRGAQPGGAATPGTRRPASADPRRLRRRPRPASSPACRRARRPARARWARALPGVRLSIEDGELVADPDHPDLLPRLPRRGSAARRAERALAHRRPRRARRRRRLPATSSAAPTT